MFKALILSLTLLLITVTVAQLGQDQQLRTVLRIAKTPKPSTSSQVPESSSQGFLPSSIPPRFVPDEPIPKSSGKISVVDPAGEVVDTSVSSELSDIIDPSTEAHLISPSGEHGQITPKKATKEEALAAANPYIKELFAIKSKSLEELKQIEGEILEKFSKAPESQKTVIAASIISEYMPKVELMLAQTDAQAEKIISKMTGVLFSVGADDTLAKEAKAAYEKEKSDKVAYYTTLIGELMATADVNGGANTSSQNGEDEGSGL